ncbi:hypothetical protein KZ829_33575 [Actinoplanes hulinensis]|uniref:Uncharacterized protein n=1 Tax=Actinoplanes hulinensis TaxID=1144547 RepID=A0ABS7BDV0_9ACTN|nr:hypothetical protein [Actinoplanes hulinensis]MBW6438669.1 hypothetical protein [Actinoplanes hulinensis]
MNSDPRRARFERLAPTVIDAVRRYLARRTDPATADDVLSETLLICWRRLERAFFAFAGKVTKINDGDVTMKVTHNYRNLEGPGVTIPQPEGSSETMPGSGRFELGKEYLVAATGNGDMLICGYSGEAGTPGLRELYEAAF